MRASVPFVSDCPVPERMIPKLVVPVGPLFRDSQVRVKSGKKSVRRQVDGGSDPAIRYRTPNEVFARLGGQSFETSSPSES